MNSKKILPIFFMGVLICALFAIYFTYVVDPEGSSYFVAMEVTDFSEDDVIYPLTDQDFKDYPVLEEIIKDKKRALLSSGKIVEAIPVFGRRSIYSNIIVPPEEAEIISQKYLYSTNNSHKIILEYNSTFYQIVKVTQ